MQQFVQQVVGGLAQGAIYGSLALALVLIYKATEVINFAQGEMAMFTTYICWSLITHHGFSYWPAFFATLAHRLRRRRRHAARRDPAARAGERADGRDGDDRAARDLQRARRVDLVAADPVLPEPVPDHARG